MAYNPENHDQVEKINRECGTFDKGIQCGVGCFLLLVEILLKRKRKMDTCSNRLRSLSAGRSEFVSIPMTPKSVIRRRVLQIGIVTPPTLV